MNSDTRVQNLLFLLAAAPLATSGCLLDGDENSDSDTDTNASGANDTECASEGPHTTDTPQTDGEDGTSSDGSDTDASATSEDGTTGDGLGPCGTYGELVGYCYDDADQGTAAAEYCYELYQAYYDAYGGGCQAAFVDYLACLSALDCETFTGPDPSCEKEFAVIEATCVSE